MQGIVQQATLKQAPGASKLQAVCRTLNGAVRNRLSPLPFQNPAIPSRCHTHTAVSTADLLLVFSRRSILTRSRGAMAVRDTMADAAPATSSFACAAQASHVAIGDPEVPCWRLHCC
jgi:hypothetical protein